MLGLGTILYTTLLFINAIAILNEERFLSKVGWSTNSRGNGFDYPSNEASVKQRLVHLISAVRVLLRIPLIVINTVVIIYELLLG
ncbi:Similar to S.cerevisiae protein YOS1 (Integral membrane protein required for ER to Golgi transport) [Malassezia sympodialis ATCC 42132]|uniref:Similar to S.cerevisiae protein YOS1 (Integral membrane protein required for ER to Golgi transport) n=1 Tax=Malassezia sympodialis (strain ATCC 42132) TaxID=1230383 RepID=A0A1M8A451_MALS4|nr:Similar to S.cerevisiae protein YOS1 (Integral membrane protein required for ER to Golgi transport) [Malassezia sympodialis ATCC 42132]